MKEVLFFSNNINKLKEIRNLFAGLGKKIYCPNDFKIIREPKESGKSFVENSKIKSLFGYKEVNLPCFADDSGICIEALNNKPGIKSKRFLEKFKTNKHAFEHIISSVVNKNNDRAFFKTAICLSIKKNHHIIFEGRINGRISRKPRGINGFGYDPIFIPDGYKKTFAEMNSKEKNTISHRLIALRKMESFLFN